MNTIEEAIEVTMVEAGYVIVPDHKVHKMSELVITESEANKLISALTALFRKVEVEARISELERFHRYGGRDYDNETDEAIDDRITELQASLKEDGK